MYVDKVIYMYDLWHVESLIFEGKNFVILCIKIKMHLQQHYYYFCNIMFFLNKFVKKNLCW